MTTNTKHGLDDLLDEYAAAVLDSNDPQIESSGHRQALIEVERTRKAILALAPFPAGVGACDGCRRGLPFNKFGHHFELIPDTGTMPCANDPRRAARPEEKSTKPTEAEIDAAIKRACGKHRVLDSYTYEDVHAVVEAVFSPPRTNFTGEKK